MGWDSTNRTLTDPISLADVGSAIGSGAPYDLGSMITTGDINPFALNKPYRAPTLQTSPRTMQFSMLGLQVPYATTVQAFINKHGTGDLGAVSNPNGWVYLRPRGKGGGDNNEDEWFRIFDFLKITSVGVFEHNAVGYHAGAPNPFGKYNGPADMNLNGGNITAFQHLPIQSQTGLPDYDIGISDLNGLNYEDGSYMGSFLADKLLYYGMLLVPVGSGTTWDTSKGAFLIASTTPIDADSNSLTTKIRYRGLETLEVSYRLTATFSPTRYRVYPFLTPSLFNTQNPRIDINYSARSTAIPGGVKIVPIPGAEPSYVTFYEDNIEVHVYATGSATGPVLGKFTVGIYVKVINRSANSVTIPSTTDKYGPNLRLRRDSHAYAYPSGAGSPSTGEVFYSSANRWNSDGSSTADSSYAALLNAIGGRTLAVGEEWQSLEFGVTFESEQAIHVGFYYGSSFHSDNIYVRTPAVPTLELNT